MGILDEVLAVTDNMRRVAGRNISDLVTDPKNAIAKTLYAGAGTAKEQMNAMVSGDVSSLIPGGSSTAGLLGTFGGVGSKTFPHAKAVLYERAIARGMPAKKATEITGIWRGPEGKLRYEIPDTGMKLHSKSLDFTDSKASKLDTFDIEHQELLRAYPQLKDLIEGTKPMLDTTLKAAQGKYSNIPSKGATITTSAPDMPRLRSATVHEFQHAIQRLEDFARGGSPSMFIPENAAILKETGNFLPLEEAAKAKGLTPPQAYRRLAGEAEARAVEGRLEYTDMGITPPANPLDSYDVPFDKMIIRK